MANSFYGPVGDLSHRGGFTADNSAVDMSTSFKIRSTKKFRPNINEMRNGASQRAGMPNKQNRTNDDIEVQSFTTMGNGKNPAAAQGSK